MQDPTLTVIGWDGPPTRPSWPDPVSFVDTERPTGDRETDAEHLGRGHVARAYLDKEHAGCADSKTAIRSSQTRRSSGPKAYGTAWWTVDHAVRLPDRFIEHVGLVERHWRRRRATRRGVEHDVRVKKQTGNGRTGWREWREAIPDGSRNRLRRCGRRPGGVRAANV